MTSHQQDYAWMDDLLFDAIMEGHVDDVPKLDEQGYIPMISSLRVCEQSMMMSFKPQAIPNPLCEIKTTVSTPAAPISVTSDEPSEDSETDWQDDDFDFDVHVDCSPRQKHCVSPELTLALRTALSPVPGCTLQAFPALPINTKRIAPTPSSTDASSISRQMTSHPNPIVEQASNSSVPLVGIPMGLDYVDYAHVPEQQQAIPPEERNTGGVQCPFPERLHDMLTQNPDAEVVSWAPHGRCFVVRKPRDFEKTVLPQFFNQTKYRSFQRQLNLYGFKRITGGADRAGYYHPLMLRGRRKLCTRMRRLKQKLINSVTTNSSLDPEMEPNFYAMSPVGEEEQETKPKESILAQSKLTGAIFTDSKSKICSTAPATLDLAKASRLTAALFAK